jgi:acylphosphatase
MNSATERCVTVRVTGRVQGVSFRYWTMEEATKLGLRGWVRNEPGGSVTALLAGSDSAVALMLERFWQGPAGAVVADVRTEEAADIAATPAGFRITG